MAKKTFNSREKVTFSQFAVFQKCTLRLIYNSGYDTKRTGFLSYHELVLQKFLAEFLPKFCENSVKNFWRPNSNSKIRLFYYLQNFLL